MAISSKFIELAKMLIEHGADLEAKMMTSKYGHGPQFASHETISIDPLRLAVLENDIKLVELLLEHGADIEATMFTSNDTPLMTSVFRGSKDITKYLIKQGAKVNVQNVYKVTPLYVATFRGYEEIVQMLISNGANTNEKCTSSRRTPLHLALYIPRMNIVEELLKNGVSLTVRDIEGDTPFESTLRHIDFRRKGLQSIKYLMYNNMNE